MVTIEHTRSRNPKYLETILIITNFNGKIKNFHFHARLLNDLGFNVTILELKHASTTSVFTIPINKSKKIGIRHKWADQVEEAMEAISGPIILFSFSHPSCAALEVLDRKKVKNITAWITDGGPFFDVTACYGNLLYHFYGIKFFPARYAVSLGLIFLLVGPRYESDLHLYLESLPPNFPILSIKTWKDKLVPASSIDKIFDPHSHLNLQSLVIPNAGHLEGVLKDTQTYLKGLQVFLNQCASPLESDSTTTGKA